jgi:hypothetical protein
VRIVVHFKQGETMKKIVLAAALASSVAFAGNPNTGCGLGSMVIQDQSSVVMQVLAVTTNGTSGNQTFGITSGTLGCMKPASIVSNEIHKFVNDNVDTLASNIANGEGEVLNTLATMLKVQDKAGFAGKLQANFSKIFSSEGVSTAKVADAIASLV